MAVAIIILGIDAIVYVQCRSLLPCHVRDPGAERHTNHGWITVLARVNIYFLLGSIIMVFLSIP